MIKTPTDDLMTVNTANGSCGIQRLPNGAIPCHNLLYRPRWSIQPSPARTPGNQTVRACEMHSSTPHTQRDDTRAQKQQEEEEEEEGEREGGSEEGKGRGQGLISASVTTQQAPPQAAALCSTSETRSSN